MTTKTDDSQMETNVVYLDCTSGIAGDMLVAALVDAGGDWKDLDTRLRSLSLPGAEWKLETVDKNGFAAKQFRVSFPTQHAHRHLSDIQKTVDNSKIGTRATEIAMKLFVQLGKAEASVHGSDLQRVHFHEVGAIDSIIDIVSIAILVDQLNIQQVFVSQICTGFGTIKIAHGQVAVPAPATARLLNGFPVYAGDEEGEMVTPTGAAFLSAFAKPVNGMPELNLAGTGTGAGNKNLKSRANVLRVYLGKHCLQSIEKRSQLPNTILESLVELQFQVDDMTGQQLGHLQSLILETGVNDCFLTAVMMKKGRPGTLVTVHCEQGLQSTVERLIFANSTTIGIRSHAIQRTILERHSTVLNTKFGPLAAKKVIQQSGQARIGAEFEEIVRVASSNGKSVLEVQHDLPTSDSDKQ